MESREIRIDKGFVESPILMTPIDFAWKNFNFYLDDQKLPIYFKNELEGGNARNKSIQNEEVIVCVYGFNQIGRKTTNDELKRQIVGDILMFYIGSYKDFKSFPTSVDFKNWMKIKTLA